MSSKLARPAIVIIALLSLAPDPRPSPNITPSDEGLLALAQPELDYLRAGSVTVSLHLDSVRPESALRAIARVGGFRLEIQGQLPDRPTASFNWEASTVKTALSDFARMYPVEYSVLRPDLLLVIVAGDRSKNGGTRP